MIQKRLTFALVACVAAVVSAWAVAGISVAAQAGAAGRLDLSGQWQLNRDLSEDAQAKFASMGGGGGHHGGVIHGIAALCDGRCELFRERRLILND